MEFTEVVRKRKMVRSFSDEPVDPGTVRRILDCARRGPSAGFSQGIEFVVVTDDETRRRFAAPGEEVFAKSGHHNFVEQAPVHVVVCVNPEAYRERYRQPDKMRVVEGMADEELWAVPYWYVDGGAAMQLLMMAAVDEGIGAAFVGGEAALLRELLSIPEDFIPIGVALLGHPAADAAQFGDVSARKIARRRYEDVVHEGRW